MSNTLLTVASSLYTGGAKNVARIEFFHWGWKVCIKPIKSLTWQRSKCKVTNVEAVSLTVGSGGRSVCTVFVIVENLAVDLLLGTWCFDWCIHEIFVAERKVVHCHLRAVITISTKTTVKSIYSDNTVGETNAKPPDDTLHDEQYLCHLHVK